MSVEQTWVFKVILAVDIFLCAVLFRDFDVTISSMTGLEIRKSKPALWAKCLGTILNTIQKNHTEMAIASDRQRAQEALRLLQ